MFSHSNTATSEGAVVGGVVGGIAFVLLCLGILWLFRRRLLMQKRVSISSGMIEAFNHPPAFRQHSDDAITQSTAIRQAAPSGLRSEYADLMSASANGIVGKRGYGIAATEDRNRLHALPQELGVQMTSRCTVIPEALNLSAPKTTTVTPAPMPTSSHALRAENCGIYKQFRLTSLVAEFVRLEEILSVSRHDIEPPPAYAA